MKQSLYDKLIQLSERYTVVNNLLAQPDVVSDLEQYKNYSKELSQLEPVVQCFQDYQDTEKNKEESHALLDDSDASICELAKQEIAQADIHLDKLEKQLQLLLLPEDEDDNRNVYLEIRAGTGGDEAAIFVGDLFRMYSRYAEEKKWQLETVTESLGDKGGFKEIISKISGKKVYAQLKFESGAHRVQRVPETESQGRVHTSACTVAVMPEVTGIDHIDVKPDELRIDTFRSSGAGGQHVNTTDSAIRITHVPTGIVVECQDERSQHKNRAKAMALLQSKILMEKRQKQEREQAEKRRRLVGSGDRSERIRTYNFPQGRLTDHRINLTLYKLADIMEGALDPVIEPLIQEHQAERLADIGLE